MTSFISYWVSDAFKYVFAKLSKSTKQAMLTSTQRRNMAIRI